MKRKAIIILFLIMTLFTLSGCSGKRIYMNPITNETYELSADQYVNRSGSRVYEGSYVIGEESQQMIITPLGENESTTLRYADFKIYAGDTWFLSSVDTGSRWVTAIQFGDSIFGDRNMILYLDGMLYHTSILDDEAFKQKNDEDASIWKNRIYQNGEKYYIGKGDFYTSNTGARFYILAFTDNFLQKPEYNEWRSYKTKDMVLGYWSNGFGYDDVYFLKDFADTKAIAEMYKTLKQECNKPYPEVIGQ